MKVKVKVFTADRAEWETNLILNTLWGAKRECEKMRKAVKNANRLSNGPPFPSPFSPPYRQAHQLFARVFKCQFSDCLPAALKTNDFSYVCSMDRTESEYTPPSLPLSLSTQLFSKIRVGINWSKQRRGTFCALYCDYCRQGNAFFFGERKDSTGKC